MSHHILIPIDLSHDGKGKDAIAMAKKMFQDGDEITLLTVLPIIPAYVSAEFPEDFQAQSRDKAKWDLSAIQKENGLPETTHILVNHGNPYHTILEVAEDKNVDLIVMASHRPGWEDYLLGSVAAKVVRHAKCSVLVQR